MTKLDKTSNRVLIICTNADLAGAPTHVRDLSKLLLKNGWTVWVVFGENGPIKDELEVAGITTHVIPSLRSALNLSLDFIAFKSFKKIVQEFRPSVIHAHSSKAGMIGRLVGLFCGIPTIYTVHGWGFGPNRKLITSIFVYVTELMLMRQTTKFITVSNADTHLGLKYLLIPKARISKIYNISNFKRSEMQSGAGLAKIIMVARDNYPKDYRTFFKSLASVSLDSVIVVGRGTDEQNFKDMARSLSGSNFKKIRFVGESSEIESFLEKSSIYVLSSRFEGLPISIIEAMSKGLPIVATAVGGIPEIVKNQKNGLLFQPGDSDKLSEILNILSLNPEIRQRYGAASIARFKEEFNKDAFIERTLKVYDAAKKSI